MKGYKAFGKGLICMGFQYEVGKTYKHNGEIGLCESGFHFCKNASDCATYYDHSISEFAEIEAIGKIIEGNDKCVTDEIVIVRLISRPEFYELANEGKNNVGVRNTGNWNTGNWNCTDRSTGLFCTEIQTVKIFDIDTGKTYEELRDLLPAILWSIPFGNYWENAQLKTYTSNDRQHFYDELTDRDKSKIKAIPNFNSDKFEKCTGIKVVDKIGNKEED